MNRSPKQKTVRLTLSISSFWRFFLIILMRQFPVFLTLSYLPWSGADSSPSVRVKFVPEQALGGAMFCEQLAGWHPVCFLLSVSSVLMLQDFLAFTILSPVGRILVFEEDTLLLTFIVILLMRVWFNQKVVISSSPFFFNPRSWMN